MALIDLYRRRSAQNTCGLFGILGWVVLPIQQAGHQSLEAPHSWDRLDHLPMHGPEGRMACEWMYGQ